MSARVAVYLSVFVQQCTFTLETVSPDMIFCGSHGREDEPREEIISGDSFPLQGHVAGCRRAASNQPPTTMRRSSVNVFGMIALFGQAVWEMVRSELCPVTAALRGFGSDRDRKFWR